MGTLCKSYAAMAKPHYEKQRGAEEVHFNSKSPPKSVNEGNQHHR